MIVGMRALASHTCKQKAQIPIYENSTGKFLQHSFSRGLCVLVGIWMTVSRLFSREKHKLNHTIYSVIDSIHACTCAIYTNTQGLYAHGSIFAVSHNLSTNNRYAPTQSYLQIRMKICNLSRLAKHHLLRILQWNKAIFPWHENNRQYLHPQLK